MLKSNFHIHTYRCNHAVGTEREYVEKAIENGLSVMGFADHSPYPFPEGYVSLHRMKMSETAEHIKEVLALREEYKNDIKIYIGFEAEYYPRYWNELLKFLSDYPYDYLILGQHFLDNESVYRRMLDPFTEKELLTKYVDECIEGLGTGKFFYLAHPDLPNFSGDADFYRSEMRRLCESAKKLDIPIELNLLGLREKRHYPVDAFWKIASEIGNDVLFGCDSHSPDAVALESDYIMGMELVKKYGLNYIEPMSPKK